jgi:hypothetical protein
MSTTAADARVEELLERERGRFEESHVKSRETHERS